MASFFETLGTAAAGEIVKQMIAGGIEWGKNRKAPSSQIIELTLGKIAERNLPDSVRSEDRRAVVTSLVELAKPTFEQIVEFNPITQRVIAHGKKSSTKKTAAKKAPAKKSAMKNATSAPNRVVKKAPVKWRNPTSSIKKAPAKKNVSKKMPRKSS